jgi:hypothetical protein
MSNLGIMTATAGRARPRLSADDQYSARPSILTMGFQPSVHDRENAIQSDCWTSASISMSQTKTCSIWMKERNLFDAGIGHEFRLVRGADHVAPSLEPRLYDALGFIGR